MRCLPKRRDGIAGGRACVLLLAGAACAAPDPAAHAGCLDLTWGAVDRPAVVPIWLVPTRLWLETEERGDGTWQVSGRAPGDTTRRPRGQEAPWYEILTDRSWVPLGADRLEVRISDGAYNAWTITLTRTGVGYGGEAAFQSRMEGVESEARAPVTAHRCPTEG